MAAEAALSLTLPLPQLLQQLPHPPRGAQLAGDVGRETQIALRVEPPASTSGGSSRIASAKAVNISSTSRASSRLSLATPYLSGRVEGQTSTAPGKCRASVQSSFTAQSWVTAAIGRHK